MDSFAVYARLGVEADDRDQAPAPRPYTVDGRPVVRVVIDCVVGSGADEYAMADIGEVLAERMGDNLDAVLGENDLMDEHEVERWWVRAELAVGEDVSG